MVTGNLAATESTHGRHVWAFDSGEVPLDADAEAARKRQVAVTAIRGKEQRAKQPDETDKMVSRIAPPTELKTWSGGATVATLAIVFTDIVDSTKLCHDFGDATWDGYRQVHFARVKESITNSAGCFIKNTGDGVIISDPLKSDLDSRRTEASSRLRWKPHAGVELKGVPGPQTLWELEGER
jgi:hypothetical protein